MMRSHRDDVSVHVGHRVAVRAAGTRLFDVAGAAAAVLVAERLTRRVLAFDDVAVGVDRAAEGAFAGMRARFARADGDAGLLAVIARRDALLGGRQAGLVDGSLL